MTPRKLVGPGVTDYSDVVHGDAGNYRLPVRFDVTDGFVGLTQYAADGQRTVTDRVLLSPTQFQDLLAFLQRAQAHRRRHR